MKIKLLNSNYDENTGKFVVEQIPYDVYVGTSSDRQKLQKAEAE